MQAPDWLVLIVIIALLGGLAYWLQIVVNLVLFVANAFRRQRRSRRARPVTG